MTLQHDKYSLKNGVSKCYIHQVMEIFHQGTNVVIIPEPKARLLLLLATNECSQLFIFINYHFNIHLE